MKIEGIFCYVPAIKKVTLRNVGFWKDATFEFSKNLNIITGHGFGKTTLLQAILGGVSNSLPANYLTDKKGEIEIEFISKRLASAFEPQSKESEYSYTDTMLLSRTEALYEKFCHFLDNAKDGYTLLMDSGVLDRVSEETFNKAILLLQKAKGQKIIVLNYRALNIKDAKIFECSRA